MSYFLKVDLNLNDLSYSSLPIRTLILTILLHYLKWPVSSAVIFDCFYCLQCLTLTPAAPSLPGGPSAPALPYRNWDAKGKLRWEHYFWSTFPEVYVSDVAVLGLYPWTCDLQTSLPGSPAGPVRPGGPTGPGGPRSPPAPEDPCFPGSPFGTTRSVQSIIQLPNLWLM